MYLSYMKPLWNTVTRCDHEIDPNDCAELVKWFADWYQETYPGEIAKSGRAGWYQRFLEFLTVNHHGFWFTIADCEGPLDEQYWSDLIDPVVRPLK